MIPCEIICTVLIYKINRVLRAIYSVTCRGCSCFSSPETNEEVVRTNQKPRTGVISCCLPLARYVYALVDLWLALTDIVYLYKLKWWIFVAVRNWYHQYLKVVFYWSRRVFLEAFVRPSKRPVTVITVRVCLDVLQLMYPQVSAGIMYTAVSQTLKGFIQRCVVKAVIQREVLACFKRNHMRWKLTAVKVSRN